MVDGSVRRYDGMTRFLHWTMAILIAAQFLKLGDRIDDGEHWIGQTIVPWHVSVGILLLVLIVVRVTWALAHRGQRPPHVGSTAMLVKGGHFLLYACMVLMPIAGILLILGSGYGLKVFGVELAAQTDVETDWMISLGSLHSPLAWLFVALVLGHIAAALFRHFVHRDDTMKRIAG
jgi:cytochrome b561